MTLALAILLVVALVLLLAAGQTFGSLKAEVEVLRGRVQTEQDAALRANQRVAALEVGIAAERRVSEALRGELRQTEAELSACIPPERVRDRLRETLNPRGKA